MTFCTFVLTLLVISGYASCMCPDIKEPVCGEDGKIYENICFLRLAGIGEAKDTGSCLLDTPIKNEADECPRFCTREMNPVCASDGLIYNNLCEMNRLNCGRNLKTLPMVECQKRGPL